MLMSILDNYHIHYVYKKTKPYTTCLTIDQKAVLFEIDTGSGLTIISRFTYEKQFMNCELLPTRIKVKTYSNEPLHVLGKLKVTVNFNFTFYEFTQTSKY